MDEKEVAATTTGYETMAERLAEVTDRFTKLIARLKETQDIESEERAVRLLAWKLEWDAMMRERESAMKAHAAHAESNIALAEQARALTAAREEEMRTLREHRANVERIYREGFANIAEALRVLTQPTILQMGGQ